jgi:hypothetical protein
MQKPVEVIAHTLEEWQHDHWELQVGLAGVIIEALNDAGYRIVPLAMVEALLRRGRIFTEKASQLQEIIDVSG